MGGETSGEEQARKTSEFTKRLTKEGVSGLEGLAAEFRASPFYQANQGFLQQIAEDPFTYNDQLKASLANQLGGQTANQVRFAQERGGGIADRLGLGFSDSGGLGLSNLAGLQGLSQNLAGRTAIENQAAQQRIPDLNRAIASLFGGLDNSQSADRAVASGQLGSVPGLSSLAGANAALAASQPGDATGKLIGSAIGGIAGSFLGPIGTVGGSALGGALAGLF